MLMCSLVVGALTALPARRAAAATSGVAVDSAFIDAVGAAINGTVLSVAVDPTDGSVVVGGAFTTPAIGLARFNADGTPDVAFNTNVAAVLDGPVSSVAISSSTGSIVVGGSFISPAAHLARLDRDGSLDQTFNSNVGTTVDGNISAIAIDESTGAIVVGGSFSSPSARLARFDSAGSLDVGFNQNVGSLIDSTVTSVVIDPAGALVVGGDFTSPSTGLARLSADGSADATFNSAVGTTLSGAVNAVALDESTGDILVGGSFTSLSSRLARFDTDGTIDAGFSQAIGSSINGTVTSMVLDSNSGEITVGGAFTTPSRRIARFQSDGTFDPAFSNDSFTIDDRVYALALGPGDEWLVAGGLFSSPGRALARFESLVVDLGQIPDQLSYVGLDVEPVTAAATSSSDEAVTYTASGLPGGLQIDSASGVISGVPTLAGTFAVTISASVLGVSDEVTFTWTVDESVSPSLSGAPGDGVAGVSYSYQLAVGGSPEPVVRTVSGELPPGLSLSPEGLISGTPTRAGSYSLTLSAANGVDPAASLATEVTIVPGDVDPGSAQVDAAPATIYADGESTSTITVVVADGYGNPVSDADVVLETTAGTLGEVMTRGNGIYQAVLRSGDEPEVALVSLTIDGVLSPAGSRVAFVDPPSGPAASLATTGFGGIGLTAGAAVLLAAGAGGVLWRRSQTRRGASDTP